MATPPSKSVTAKTLSRHASRVAGLAGHQGYWNEGGTLYLDATKVHPNTPHGAMSAISDMGRNKQQAVYNMDRGQTFWNTSHPRVLHDRESLPGRLRENATALKSIRRQMPGGTSGDLQGNLSA